MEDQDSYSEHAQLKKTIQIWVPFKFPRRVLARTVTVFRRFREIAKSTVSFVMSAHPSA
jgi:hypothetical protein